MQTTEMTTDVVTAARATIFARMIHGLTADGDARPAFEQAKRVAQAVETHRQQAILWLHQTLKHETVTCVILMALGFDRLVVDAADTLSIRYRESVRDYAKRIAACDDTDVLAVAVALIDNQIKEGVERVEDQDGTLAWKKARRVLKRATDALANQQPGDTPPAGGVADNRPTAPALRSALMKFTDHTNGAREAMTQMMRGPGNVAWEVSERLSPDDLELLIGSMHALMQIVALLVIDVTALENEDTYEDRMTLAESRMEGVSLMQGLATMARTVARRLRDFNEWHGGEELENGKVH